MWVHEMTDEQKREYGFVDLSISDMHRLGYTLAKSGWKKVRNIGANEESSQSIIQ